VARALALDVTDGGILAVAEGGTVLGPSPGYALVDAGRVLFGTEALAAARLRPRFVASRHWQHLDTQPLGLPFPDGLSAADLVHAHLESLWKPARAGTTEVVVAAPGVYLDSQLGLLAGIAQSLGMPLAGFVDAAVAAASAGYPGERLVYVDLGLHRAFVTEVRQGEALTRERVAGIDRWGLDEVSDLLARRLAEAFVRGTRFDPLHAAETEQALFDSLPGWLAALERQERVTLVLEASGREHALEVERATVEAWADDLAEELQQQVSLLKHPGEPTTVLVSARASRLPGLVPRLAAIRGVEVALAPVQAAAAGALRERDAVRAEDGALRFATRLPRRAHATGPGTGDEAVFRPPPAPARPLPVGTGRRPTHVLLGTVARAISEVPLVLGTAPPEGTRSLRLEGDTAGVSRVHCRLVESGGEVVVEDLSTWGTFLNGERVAGRAVVSSGDRLRVGSPGIELLLIAEAEG
jgi:hypothetical protein